jgi:hypothetical protein
MTLEVLLEDMPESGLASSQEAVLSTFMNGTWMPEWYR